MVFPETEILTEYEIKETTILDIGDIVFDYNGRQGSIIEKNLLDYTGKIYYLTIDIDNYSFPLHEKSCLLVVEKFENLMNVICFKKIADIIRNTNKFEIAFPKKVFKKFFKYEENNFNEDKIFLFFKIKKIRATNKTEYFSYRLKTNGIKSICCKYYVLGIVNG